MKLSVFYFSGTGNTAFIVKRIVKTLSRRYETAVYDVAGGADLAQPLKEADLVLIAFPIYGGAPPIPMRRFVHAHADLFRGKNIAIAETQYFFSGDGAATIGRTLEKFGGTVIAAEHFNMPNNIADSKFGVKNGEELRKKLTYAQVKADKFAEKILDGKKCRRGFTLLPHAVGYYSQRKYWRKGEAEKRGKLKIDPSRCVGCRACVKSCPVSNLTVEHGKAKGTGKCVFCYRCVNLCPKKAISLFGKEPPKAQYKGPFLC